MTKIKSISIFVLSVLLAFETGAICMATGFVMALEDEKKEQRVIRRTNYRDYCRRD
jgi:hypothetical protein